MNAHLLDLPDEILELIAFNVIDGPWIDDVRHFLSFTSTCKRFYQFFYDERFWQKLASRRDPTNEKPTENTTWLNYCQQIYLMRTIPSNALRENISRFDDNYYCTIEKLIIWPDKIRIYIDERGDYSLGPIQHPRDSIVALVENDYSQIRDQEKRRVFESKFSIADQNSRYLGYLDFSISLSCDPAEQVLNFRYGFNGYSIIKLFKIEKSFIDKFNLQPLMRRRQSIV
ncbi:unnamed protein product [Rotaria socialis]|uniref:F-box domain-containing protein n=2 Tax=Rotaria socialis TaxID=392032 RepID=A0A820HAE3_9BILA|nr:unnamed protein product [Rotaria socialis]CAF3384677.1 unnamed protein product [Rotaria socialis]CAF4127194.1 unnamed protein product [Rotaria socialis]CAF4290396.1 unnamed protein product [Rotaria socialis]CAF4499496.1 unnamed protein product [Rotaria socialis]